MQNPIFNRANAQPFNLQIRNAADAVELTVYGVVGDTFDGVTPGEVATLLKANRGKRVNVKINSPGGLAYDGIAIANALIAHSGFIDVVIEGIAASAAAVIAMAGDVIRMFENSSLMIHRGHLIVAGNEADLQEARAVLLRLDDQLATTIATRRSIPKSKVVKLMLGDGGDGTTFNAKEAMSTKLVDEIIELGKAKKIGNRADSGQQARARKLRLMEIDGHNSEHENAMRRGGPDAVARERRLAEIAGHAREFATS